MAELYVYVCLFLFIGFFILAETICIRNTIESFKAYHDDPEYTVREVPNFLSSADCDAIIKVAKSKGMVKSKVYTSTHDALDTNIRDSEQTWLNPTDDDVCKRLSDMVAGIVGIPSSHQESIQVVHYEIGGKYEPHYDACVEDTEACKRLDAVGGGRLLTAMVYLNDVEKGGHTHFPVINRSVTPEKGKLVIFTNLHRPSEDVISQSKHGGDPVRSGEKWIANIWIHLRPRI